MLAWIIKAPYVFIYVMLTWITKTPHVIIYLMLTWITQTTTAMTDCLKVIFIYADLDHQDP